MSEQPGTQYIYEDVIDLRELIQTLWDAKWIIIGVTLTAALAAFLVSSFLLPAQYQAEAFVTLLEPNLRVELEPSIQSEGIQLDSSGLPDLAQSAAVRERVFQELEITDQDQRGDYEFAASLVGGDQLQLQVTARDPEPAAGAANTWAAMVVETLNTLYGEGETTERALEEEVQRAREAWQSAQEALEAYYPQNEVESLRVELAAAKSRLALYQSKADQIQLMQIDVNGLRGQLEEIPAGSQLSTSRYLALIALQQRAVSVSSAAYFQEMGDEVSGQSGDTVLELPETGFTTIQADEARTELEALRAALLTAEGDVRGLSHESVAGINQLRVGLELEEYQLAERTEERDLARQAYSALRGQLEEYRISRAQQDSVARVGAEAIAPNDQSGLSKTIVISLAGVMGFMLSILGVLIVSWWLEESNLKNNYSNSDKNFHFD